jgi:hypothetical protein
MGCAIMALNHTKPVRLTKHAKDQCEERGATEQEVIVAVLSGVREPAKMGRLLCRYNFTYNKTWQGQHYSVKQVAPVISEEQQETVVITVYTFYF